MNLIIHLFHCCSTVELTFDDFIAILHSQCHLVYRAEGYIFSFFS